VAGERCVDRWKVWHEFALDRRLAKITERIVVNSSGVRDFYVSRGLSAEKFVVIANGVEPFDPGAPTSRGQLLAELGLPPDARLIAAIGRLWPQKRIKDLIWAADLLKVARDDAHLLIIGDGPQRWRLLRFRDQVEICDRVHFLGQRSDVPRILAHVDCLWLGSGYEGQSNAILEAMAAAAPVVATDIAGNRDLVRHEETGYLAPVGDRAAFARRTSALLDDPELARRLGLAGQKRVREEFSVEKMVRRHAALYHALVEG
jgi:glycosyltransferase involved in cell wall biosynthesis